MASRMRIVSDGTVSGAKVALDGKAVEDVQAFTFTVDVRAGAAGVRMEMVAPECVFEFTTPDSVFRALKARQEKSLGKGRKAT